MLKTLVIGGIMLDVVIEIDRLPARGMDIYAQNKTESIGGCAYNVAHILQYFHISYDLFAPIGRGHYANTLSRLLQYSHVKSLVHDEALDNGCSLCFVDKTGERTFITISGIETQFNQGWFAQLDTGHYDSVYVCGYEIEGAGGESIISFLQNNPHLTIYYAPGPRISHIDHTKNMQLMTLHPILHLNEQEAMLFTNTTHYKKAAKALYSMTNNAVIITRGERGCYMYGAEELALSGTPSPVVDTIGAGDAHLGTIIAMRKRHYDWHDTLCMANKVAAQVVSMRGATFHHATII